MFGFVLSLAVLSLMFSVLSGIAMAMRRMLFRGREWLMFPVWVVLLVISVVPARLWMPTVTLSVVTGDAENLVESYSDETPVRTPDSDTGAPEQPVSYENSAEPLVVVRLRKAAAGMADYVGTLSTALFLLWFTGAAIGFAVSMNSYFEAKKLLDSASMPALDARLLRVLSECREDVGVSGKVRLRVFVGEAICSPCVSGCVCPTIYIDPDYARLSDTELRCVLAHELYHIKRCDMLCKLFCLFVTSVHWMNPSSKKVRKAIYEDIELSCDRGVINTYGKEVSGVYMKTILDFAERFSAKTRVVGAEGLNGGLFISDAAGADALRKRYANMKHPGSCRVMTVVTVVFCVAAVMSNSAVFSYCSKIDTGSIAGAISLSKTVDSMVRAYYGIGGDDYITPEMVDGINTLSISADVHKGRVYVKFAVNGDDKYSSALPVSVRETYWGEHILPALDKADSTARAKMNAFYCRRDAGDPTLTERGRAELLSVFPELGQDEAVYYFDPYASQREVDMMYEIMYKVGLAESWEVPDLRFDASSLAYFSNLKQVSFVGLEPVNCAFPKTVSVTVESAEADDGFINIDAAQTAVTEN